MSDNWNDAIQRMVERDAAKPQPTPDRDFSLDGALDRIFALNREVEGLEAELAHARQAARLVRAQQKEDFDCAERLRALLAETLDFLNPDAYTDHEDLAKRIRAALEAPSAASPSPGTASRPPSESPSSRSP